MHENYLNYGKTFFCFFKNARRIFMASVFKVIKILLKLLLQSFTACVNEYKEISDMIILEI